MRVPLNKLLYAASKALDFVEEELLGITSNHGKRVGYFSGYLCRQLGMSEVEIFDMAGCAMLHDSALTEYMLEAGPGDIARLEHFKSHCVHGEKNAKAFPWMGDVDNVILYHHENWDGSGFHKLRGNEIPIRSQILRLADNLDLELRMGDARSSLKEEMRAHARSYSGTIYSPDIVDVMCDTIDNELIEKMHNENIINSLENAVPSIKVTLNTQQLLEVCTLFASIVDAKSPYTKNHSTGIADKATRLADLYAMDTKNKHKIIIAAYLHDIGKLSTPRSVLEKSGPLTPEEWKIMQLHASMSEKLLMSVEGLEEIAGWCGNHHEKLNGAGYPQACTSHEIPFEARLITCCDIYQALTENRSYRRGMTHEKSIKIMYKMAEAGEIDGNIVSDVNRVFG